MSSKKVIAICISGGDFVTDADGVLSYTGGEAYAVDLDGDTQLNDFKKELAETFPCSVERMSIKYFLPGNKKRLITISKDKDLQRLVNFFKDSEQVEVYVTVEEVVTSKVSKRPAKRPSKPAAPVQEAALPAVPDREMVLPATAPVAAAVSVAAAAAAVDVIPSVGRNDLTNCVTPGSYIEKHRKVAMQWENTITGVGQRFSSFRDFLDKLRKYSVAHGFSYTYKRKDSHRVTVLCKSKNCPWRINVSRLPTTQLICIKKITGEHTCDGQASFRATREWLEGIIKDKLKVSPNYKPKDIADDINREYGIQLSYSRARRAKESAREQLQGSYKDSYNQLPFFCEKIMVTNPGSLATFSTKEDSSFHRLFVSFHASIAGFQQGCRPLLVLNSTPINSKYPGMLLAATAADGDDGVFPVAFAIVDEESNDNWRWFVTQLKSAVSTTQPITFVADIEKGLRESLRDIFGKECYHGYCLDCLAEKFNKDLKVQLSYEARHLLVQELYAAAYAQKIDAFERVTENVKSISPEAYNWIIQSEPDHWANVFFGGARYNLMTSSFGKPFYSWLSEANDLPITQMVNVLRGKIMELIYSRRVDSSQWVERLTPSMEEKLRSETSKARSLQVLLSHGSTYEVRGESVDIVDIGHWGCSCRVWQLTGLPCCHAVAVLGCLCRSLYDYCSKYFSVDSYRLTYAESIHPVPNVDRPERGEVAQTAITITPPPTRRPPGRPKMIKSGAADIVRREVQCSVCKGFGHTKRRCKQLIREVEEEGIQFQLQ